MANVSNVTYRFSNIEDYEAIRVLSVTAGVMPDVDYIQESYPELMKDPLFYAAVAECNGEVIGFSAAMVHMKGKKIFSRSGRVNPEWRNWGIFGKLKKFIQKSLHESIYPQLKFEEFGTHNTNPALQRVIDNPRYTEIYRKPYVTHKLGQSALMSVNPDCCVNDIGIEGLRRIILDTRLCSELLTPRVFVGLVHYEPEISETELMVKYNPLILASYGKDERDISEISIGVHATFKLYTIHWWPKKNREADTTPLEIVEHIKRQFMRVKEINPNCNVQTTFPYGYEELVKETCRILGLIPVKSWATELLGFRTECF